MKGFAVTWLSLAILAGPVRAQALRPVPYEGTVVGTNVYVRSGPGGPGAYPCAKLSRPARVVVIGRLEDWLKIRPPAGCYSVISKTYVKVDPATGLGTVTGNNVWVRAGGVLRTSDFFSLQTRLSKGDRVRVLGEVGEYYKIAPPPDAYFWISAKYVKPTSAVTAASRPAAGAAAGTAATTRPIGPTSRPAAAATTPATRPPRPATTTAGGTAPPEIPPALKAFKKAEQLLVAECRKPIGQWDFTPVVAAYKAVDCTGDNAYLKPYVDARMKYIQDAKE
ncbi:MAG: SH3 domain-containing protein, partial [Planctomycetes bacterium]|nr:SH3 domain-containing protein [Planctomycetota bacterium]